jgi:hypothetical protein
MCRWSQNACMWPRLHLRVIHAHRRVHSATIMLTETGFTARFCANPICPRNMTPVSFVLDWRVAWCKTRPWKDPEYISSHWRNACARCFPDAAQSKATLEFPNRDTESIGLYMCLLAYGWVLGVIGNISHLKHPSNCVDYLHKWPRPAII